MADSNTWLIYALASMLLFSVSNVMLKTAVETAQFSKVDTRAMLGIVITCILAVAIIYLAFLQPALTGTSLTALAIITVLSLGAVGLEILSLQTGQVALVNAILGFSTIGVAVLSYMFLGDRFTIKEVVAIILATASVLILVF